jgi:arginyl-tRNA synthetase
MKYKICELISKNVQELSNEEIFNSIEIPPKKEMGDFSFPCFKLSKIYKKSPSIIAEELKNQLIMSDLIDNIEVIGAYLNIYVDKKEFAKLVVDKFKDSESYGSSSLGIGQTICIDYSSPNVAKNFHVGHLRTTIIGNSLFKIFTKLGYNVVRINHLGDWGTQFGKLIVAYKKWGSKEAVEANGVAELMSIYIKFHDEAEKDDTLNDEARKWFSEMEKGNQEALEIWKWFVEISLKEYMKTYQLLDIEFDSYAGESFYNDKMKSVVDELNDKGILLESEGAKIVDLSEDGMPPCLITKRDGSTLYATRDIAAAFYRKNTYDFSKCIYVTGQEQKLHFAQWMKVVEKMGYEWANQLVHVPYGMVSLPEGKVSTRKGNIIYAEDILREAIQKTKDIINEKNPDLADKDLIAEQIGVGAVIFNDLFNGRIKDVVFTWEKVLNFDGETGPYVQYTHVRSSSVLRKAEYVEPDFDINFDGIQNEVSLDLLKQIANYGVAIKDAGDKLEPSIVSRYLVVLAQAFNKFYHECPIIVEDIEIKKSRLLLVYITKIILKDGLALLGIKAPDQM